MRRLAVIALVFVGAGCGKSHVPMVHAATFTDLDLAREVAVRENRLVAVFALADWSVADKMLEHETLSSPAVRRRLGRGFVVARLDMTDDENPLTRRNAERMRVVGVPSSIFLSPDLGTELGRLNEFVTAEQMAAHLDEAERRWHALAR